MINGRFTTISILGIKFLLVEIVLVETVLVGDPLYHKLVKDASNLGSFYGSHIDRIICVKQIGLGLARTLNKY